MGDMWLLQGDQWCREGAQRGGQGAAPLFKVFLLKFRCFSLSLSLSLAALTQVTCKLLCHLIRHLMQLGVPYPLDSLRSCPGPLLLGP